jgi:hypothetical protein
VQVGRQIRIAPDWFFEMAAGYDTGQTTVGNFAVTKADRFDFGAALKRQIGPWVFAAALDGGYAALDTTRNINVDGAQSATSKSSLWRLDSRLRGAYLIGLGSAYFKPSLDLDVIYTAQPAFNETGAGVLDLRVASASNVAFAASPMLELGQTTAWSNGQAMRPYVQGGATFLSHNDWSLNSTFEGAPAGAAPLTMRSSLPQTLWKVSGGVDFFGIAGIRGLDLRLQYEARFGSDYRDQTGLLKLIHRF